MSGLLRLLGVYQGKSASATDYFENDLLVATNDLLLVSLDCSWAHLRKELVYADMPSEFVPRIRSLLNIDFRGDAKIVSLKDPRIALLLDAYIKAFWQIETPLFIVRMNRPREEVCASLDARGNQYDDDLYEKYNERLDFLIERYEPRHVDVEFVDLLEVPIRVLEHIEISFELDLGIDNKAKEILQFVNPDLKRH